jgi:L-fuconolactonase
LIVDAHQHYGPDTPVAGSFEPADLHGELRAAGIDATVLVQAADTAAENARLAAYAAATPTVAGVVAWLGEPLPAAVGVRRLVGREPLDWLDPAHFAQLAERGLAWDIVAVTAEQVRAVCALADAVPGLRIVVDHLARPPLEGGRWEPWEDRVRELARRPNVAMKVSVGIDALQVWEWDARALARPVAHALDCFGPERLMLASNWPVVLLRASYARAWGDLALACGEDPRILGATAVRWYGLQT